MGCELLVPESINSGWSWGIGKFRIAINKHTLQSDQKWLMAISFRGRVLGYRTRGDSSPEYLTYYDGGWWFPWQGRHNEVKGCWMPRVASGRYP